jgi:hypothetical protein
LGGEAGLVLEGVGVGVLEAFEVAEGAVEEAVVAVEGVGEAEGALAIELGDEAGVAVAPAVDGLALDADGLGDFVVGLAGEDQGDGGELAGGEEVAGGELGADGGGGRGDGGASRGRSGRWENVRFCTILYDFRQDG